MASPTFRQALESDKLIQRRLVDTIRAKYGIAADRTCHLEIRDRDYSNDVEVNLCFDPTPISLPTELSEMLDKVAERLHDPFRGPVLQAAVPELHADLVKLIAALEKINQPVRFTMLLDAARTIIRE